MNEIFCSEFTKPGTYRSIANNTFSYVLTLDEFRNEIPIEYRPSWVKLTTITMISKFQQDIDIGKIRDVFQSNTSFGRKLNSWYYC